MAKFRTIINSFNGGVIAPQLFGLTTSEKYKNCCKTLQNMIPHPLGGASRRPGSQYFAPIADDAKGFLIPFVYSEDKTYVFCLSTGDIEGWDTLVGGTPGGTASITGTNPYTEVYAPGIQYCQSADVLYLVHPSYKPQRVTRTAPDTFTLADFDSGLSGQTLADAYPYRDVNTSAATLALSAGSGSVTVTGSAGFFTSTGASSTHIGAIYKFKGAGGSNWGAFQITAVASATSATATVLVTPDSTTAAATWVESAWSNYRGWPRTVCFYLDRLCYGGNQAQPDSIWFSTTSDYDALSLSDPTASLSGSTPFWITLLSLRLNEVNWMSPGKKLVVGTVGDEYIIGVADASTAFGADNISVISETSYGSEKIQAIRVGSAILFVERGGRNIREFVFDYEQDSYKAEDLSLHVGHLNNGSVGISYPPYVCTTNMVVQTAWDSARKTLWMVNGNGDLLGLTRDRASGISAWHTHILGGTDVKVKSFITIPNGTHKNDDIFVCVARTINGGTKHYIEVIRQDFVPGDVLFVDGDYGYCDLGVEWGPVFTDSAALGVEPVTGAVTSGTLKAGFSHLIGETIVGLADGYYFEGLTVDGSGNITLPFEATYVIAGLANTPTIEPLRIEAGSQVGSAQGATKRIHKAVIRFYNSIKARIGRDSTHLETPVFRSPTLSEELPTPLFTGDKTVTFPGDYDSDAWVYITSDQPFPLTVAGVMVEGLTYD